MLRNLGRRYQPEVNADASKPDTKPTGAATKRRALGDITNAPSSEETKDNAVKKTTSKPIQVPAIQIEVVTKPTEKIDPRDYMRRESDDIDARDSGNPNLATCYVTAMYNNFGILEKEFLPAADYMDDQPYINSRMRCILVDWLVRFFSSSFVSFASSRNKWTKLKKSFEKILF